MLDFVCGRLLEITDDSFSKHHVVQFETQLAKEEQVFQITNNLVSFSQNELQIPECDLKSYFISLVESVSPISFDTNLG